MRRNARAAPTSNGAAPGSGHVRVVSVWQTKDQTAQGERALSETCCISARITLAFRSRFSSPCSFGALAARSAMDASTLAAAAVAAAVHHAETAAVAEAARQHERNARLQEALQRTRGTMRAARSAVRRGDMHVALRLIAAGLREEEEEEEEQPQQEPESEGHRCALCRLTWPSVTLMLAIGRWAMAAFEERLVCDACLAALPPQ